MINLKPYKTIGEFGEDEFIVNKSRFIGASKHVETEEDALAFIAQRRALHKDANHCCYAYIIGRNAGIMRYSDDGEPGGTAGMPIMEVLRNKGVVDCVVTVNRYFGGILLGAGGLVRAYTQGCVIGVEAAGEVLMRPCIDFMFDMPYNLLGRLENELKGKPVMILSRDFAGDITLEARIPSEYEDEFNTLISEISAGRSAVIKTDEGFYPWKDPE